MKKKCNRCKRRKATTEVRADGHFEGGVFKVSAKVKEYLCHVCATAIAPTFTAAALDSCLERMKQAASKEGLPIIFPVLLTAKQLREFKYKTGGADV